MQRCNICPRECNIDRDSFKGLCRSTNEISISKAMLHMWEEPYISGEGGSGAIFFSGCNLSCIYCQNSEISRGKISRSISKDNLSYLMLKLEELGASNINLITASHFAHLIGKSIEKAKINGLSIPIVYNSSGYEKVETLKKLDGLIDIYLPDFKYFKNETAKRYSAVDNYVEVAKSAIDEMFKQTGPLVFEDNLLKKGVSVRHLVLPGHISEAKDIIDYLHDKYADDIFISIMNQYVPMYGALKDDVINRRLTASEYEEVIDFSLMIGVKNALIQDSESQNEIFTPDFNDCDLSREFINKQK